MKNKKFTLEELQSVRSMEGIYALTDNDKIIYIGYSRNLYIRSLEHSFEVKKQFNNISFLETSGTVAEVLEFYLIYKIRPKENILHTKDFKSWYFSLPSIVKNDISSKMKKDNYSDDFDSVIKFLEERSQDAFKQ